MRPLAKWAIGIVSGLVVLAAVLWFTPTSDYVVLPGITENLNRIIHVADGTTPKGRLLMVAVTLEPANLFYDLYARLTPFGEIIPDSELAGPGGSTQQYMKESALEMKASHEYAKVAALSYLGYDAKETGDGAQVFYDLKNMPAQGKLQAGDVIVSVDGTTVQTAQQLTDYMQTNVKPGQTVELGILRHGKKISLKVGTKKDPTAPSKPLMGVAVGTDHASYVVPVPIKIATGDITGPSAGMMFALEIISQLRPTWHLAHGSVIAGTGAIEPNGTVDQIGGIREKVITVYDAGAKVFLVPAANYQSAVTEEKALGITGKMALVKVRNLSDAVAALRNLNIAGAQGQKAAVAH